MQMGCRWDEHGELQLACVETATDLRISLQAGCIRRWDGDGMSTASYSWPARKLPRYIACSDCDGNLQPQNSDFGLQGVYMGIEVAHQTTMTTSNEHGCATAVRVGAG